MAYDLLTILEEHRETLDHHLEAVADILGEATGESVQVLEVMPDGDEEKLIAWKRDAR